jgi:rhamnulokinase
MPERGKFLTFDLGAESGRAVLGTLEAGKIALDEIHRFPNEPQRILDRFHWDTVRLFAEIKTGIAKCIRTAGNPDGIGVDTWGVDFALLDRSDELLGIPYHYRDHRTDGVMERTFAIVPRDEIYRSTGIQFMQLNTLFQLMAMRFADSTLLDSARSLLFTPDLLNFWLTGRKANEFTIATTSQCYDPQAGDWARPMLERLGLPGEIFGEIVQTGTVLGPLHDTVRNETGAGKSPVIAPATHDTGSAVAGVPAEGNTGWAYISCGTWSLVGVEVDRPVIDVRTLEFNLTNEGGVNHTFRLLRNVMGLWLLQQCRRAWEKQGRTYSYQELAAMGEGAQRFGAVIDPDDPSFLNPADMPAAIADFCRKTDQEPPDDAAATVRCIVESLALKYRWVIERLELATNQEIDRIHIIGGGSQNRELCQAAAGASGRTVLAGPVEATALGNVVVQAIATGRIGSLDDGRALIRHSFPLTEYRPQNSDAWEEPYRRFLSVLSTT